MIRGTLNSGNENRKNSSWGLSQMFGVAKGFCQFLPVFLPLFVLLLQLCLQLVERLHRTLHFIVGLSYSSTSHSTRSPSDSIKTSRSFSCENASRRHEHICRLPRHGLESASLKGVKFKLYRTVAPQNLDGATIYRQALADAVVVFHWFAVNRLYDVIAP